MKNAIKYLCSILALIILLLCFPVVCSAGSLSFPWIGIQQITPRSSYLYITKDSVMNSPLITNSEINPGEVQSAMKHGNVELAVFPDPKNLDHFIELRPIDSSRVKIKNDITELENLPQPDLEDLFYSGLSDDNEYTITLYSTQLVNRFGYTWWESYYNCYSTGAESNQLNYKTMRGGVGFSVTVTDYSGRNYDELRNYMGIFINSLTFTDRFITGSDQIETVTPSPTLPAIPDAQKAKAAEPQTINLINDESSSEDGNVDTNIDNKFSDWSLFTENGSLTHYWWLYLIILYLFTFIILCLPFVIYRFIVLKHPISRKRSRRIVIIYMVCYFVLSVALELYSVYTSGYSNSTVGNSSVSILPLIIWGDIDIKILTIRSKSLKKATKLLKKFEKSIKRLFGKNISLELNDRIRMLGISSCVASVLVEGIKRDYTLSEDLLDAAREQLLIQTDDKELTIINSFVDAVNERVRNIALSQDRSHEGWLDEMFYKYAELSFEYFKLKDHDDNKARIVDIFDDVYYIVDTDVERVKGVDTESRDHSRQQKATDSERSKTEKQTSRSFFTKKKELEFYDENSTLFDGTDLRDDVNENPVDDYNDNSKTKRTSLSEDSMDQIMRWKDLYDTGVITEAEFLKKKQEILHLAGKAESKLITCPDCGKRVSSQALSCPNCGKPLKMRVAGTIGLPRRTVYIIAAVIAIIGVVALFVTKPWGRSNRWIAKADKSVLFIGCFDSNNEPICTGSGFLMFDDKTVVTNYHVIEDAKAISVFTNNNVEYSVKKIRNYDADADLAILSLSENTGLHPLSPGDSSKVNKGDEVVAIGSPEGLQNSVSTGVLSGRTDIDLQFTAPVSHGSSGGALFNSSGEVIGVTYSSLESGQSLNFAIPIEEVVQMYYDD